MSLWLTGQREYAIRQESTPNFAPFVLHHHRWLWASSGFELMTREWIFTPVPFRFHAPVLYQSHDRQTDKKTWFLSSAPIESSSCPIPGMWWIGKLNPVLRESPKKRNKCQPVLMTSPWNPSGFYFLNWFRVLYQHLPTDSGTIAWVVSQVSSKSHISKRKK